MRKRNKDVERMMHALRVTLTAARQRQGLTQAQLGQLMGVTAAEVAALETGRCDPRLSTLAAWAVMLGYRLEFEVRPRRPRRSRR